jgi:hypothetical protein
VAPFIRPDDHQNALLVMLHAGREIGKRPGNPPFLNGSISASVFAR